VNFVTNFFMKFSGGGWWNHIKPEDWDSISATSIIFLFILSVFTFIWLIVRVFKNTRDTEDTKRQRIKIKPPLFFLYFIVNLLITIAVLCIGLTVGGVWGFGFLGIVWFVVNIGSAMAQVQEDDDKGICGVFGLFEWVDEYGNAIAKYMLYRENLNIKYKTYLKNEY